jgi:hypothetical protein
MLPLIGQPLEPAPFFEIRNEYLMRVPVDFRWLLRGVTSHQRFANTSKESCQMLPLPQLGRLGATCAAFIPLKKKQAWWELSEQEKLEIYSGDPLKTASSLRNFQGIANQLHHSRDLGEPFDFLAWFEYKPEEAGAFEEMVACLRASEEWRYVEREVDVRLVKRVA